MRESVLCGLALRSEWIGSASQLVPPLSGPGDGDAG